MRIHYHTLGCKVNQYDTQAMAELFTAAGWETVGEGQPADVVLLNTCTVTAEADRKCRQLLRRFGEENPDALLVAAGCYARREGAHLVEEGLADLVIGTEGRSRVVELTHAVLEGQVASPANTLHNPKRGVFEPLTISEPGERTRANLKIQEGCDRFCTYCIIPYVRGPIRSRDEADALAEARRLADVGVSELVLTGIHIASYGRDRGENPEDALLSLLSGLSAIPGIARLRLGSLEPVLMTSSFVERLGKIPGLCPHFHLSLQSGCDATLSRMHRRYTAGDYLRGLDTIRTIFPRAAITTDVIAGFPGETEEEFTASCKTVERAGFSRIHIFPYSRREGTPAASMPGQCTREEKRRRVSRLGIIATNANRSYLSGWLGQEVSVLAETCEDGLWMGYTPEYIRVKFSGEARPGEILPVRITQITEEPDTCIGERIIHG